MGNLLSVNSQERGFFMLDGYWLSPLRRALFEPLIYLRNGSPLRRYWNELEESQYLPEAILKERQWQKLKNLLRFVMENNTFYRARFKAARITPDMVLSPEDMQRIPILTKEEIRRNTRQMMSKGFDKAGLLHFKTGGSTGKALDIYLTEECSEFRNACARRHDRWTGWEVGEPIAAVWGNPHLPTGIKDRLKNWLLTPTIYLDTMSVSERSIRHFAREWSRVRPTLLFGHAHSIHLLAQYVSDLNITDIKPRGILSTSMMLMPHERINIEGVFGIKVTDRYGCEEVSLIASECQKHEGMHMNIEHLFIEFINDDGSHASYGKPGKIVVTDLMNYAMPFIRYQVEDIGVPSDRTCSCGRGLPLMEQVTGRVSDFLVKKDGSRVAGVSLIENTLTKIRGIDQMQIVQETIDSITLRIVPGKDYAKAVDLELVSYFKHIFGSEIEIEVKITSKILPEPSGKYRFSICKI
jgi:phenylacetate-CoA ligase